MSYTLQTNVQCSGIGVHSGQCINLRLLPASAGTGFKFVRTDLGGPDNFINATLQTIVNSRFNTQIGEGDIKVSTVEHVLAALTALHVTDVIIEVDGPEIPIMDGSAAPFVFLIQCAGLAPIADTRPFLVLKEETTIKTSYGAEMLLEPSHTFSIDVEQDFNGREGVQNQSFHIEDVYDSFITMVASARTFGFYQDAQKMWSAGLSKGASLDNTVVMQEGSIMNKQGLRYTNECARHKALDIIGDFALLGMGLQLACIAKNPGHGLNAQVMKTLLENQHLWRLEHKSVCPKPKSQRSDDFSATKATPSIRA